MSKSNGGLHLVAAAATLFGTAIASAADLPARIYAKASPPPRPLSTWSGCYAGANIGGGWDNAGSYGIAFAGVPIPPVDAGGNRGGGLIGGGQIGCDYQVDAHWIVGIQGKAEFGDVNSSNLTPVNQRVLAAYQVKNTETLTARLGYTLAPTVLAYAKGGAAWTRANATALTDQIPMETASFTMNGYTVGAGLEWMIAPGWSVFGEYNYMDFGTANVDLHSTGRVAGTGPAGALSDTIAMRLRSQEALVGVNYRFSASGPVIARY